MPRTTPTRLARLARLALATLATALLAPLAACGPGANLVGAACTTDRDCVSVCVAGDRHYPGGICTVRCSTDRDCPGNAACVDDSGGICALLCENAGQCSGLGRGFTCDETDRRGSGRVRVCRVP